MSGLAWPVSELSVGGVRMSGLGAGCPAAREEPDVRADGVQLRVRSVMGAGCPGPVAAGSSSFSFLCFRARLALVLGLSLDSSGVPEYAQGPRLK